VKNGVFILSRGCLRMSYCALQLMFSQIRSEETLIKTRWYILYS